MTPAAVAMGIAVILAAIGLMLAHRSRVCSGLYPIRRGMCPQCQEILWLPLRVCPLCGTEIKDERYREAIDGGRREAKRREQMLLRRSQRCIRLAWILLIVGFLLGKVWPIDGARTPSPDVTEGWEDAGNGHEGASPGGAEVQE